MNIRRKNPPDSLYMLLDTMCNAFGGIILLAVLVTLLTSTERESRAAAAATDSRDMLQRRLAMAESNLQNSAQLLASLQAKTKDPNSKEQLALLAERQELEAEIQQARESADAKSRELDSAAAADPGDRLKFLNAELASAQARKLEAQNSLAAAEENTRHIKSRLDALNRQVTAKFNESVQTLRLPKEHQTSKRVMYVIAQFGAIYPCRNTDFSRNDDTIRWNTRFLSEEANPIAGKGIDLSRNPRELQSYFDNLSKDEVYLVFIAFEDSFPAFLKAKQMALAGGFTYGWEPFRKEDGPVVFSQHGHTTNPQ